MNRSVIFILASLFMLNTIAQDPHFSQFYSAPLSVNPAYTGVFNGSLRAISNYRQQWFNASSSYNTGTFSIDGKIRQKEIEFQNPLNAGVMFMNDNSLNGAFKSIYTAGSVSYHVTLDEDRFKSLGAGLQIAYGNRRVDFSQLYFDEQFTNNGFDVSLPTGEVALTNMKPFVSVGAGLLFLYNNKEEGIFFDLGVSGYHLNKPTQTVISDDKQILPFRISVQSSFQRYLQSDLLLNIKAVYQQQSKIEYLLAGLSIAKLVGHDNQQMVGVGCWYRTKDAIIPYIFLEYNRLQIGISNDVTVSNFKVGRSPASSWELSLQFKIGDGSWLH